MYSIFAIDGGFNEYFRNIDACPNEWLAASIIWDESEQQPCREAAAEAAKEEVDEAIKAADLVDQCLSEGMIRDQTQRIRIIRIGVHR